MIFLIILVYLPNSVFSFGFSKTSITIEAGFDGRVKPAFMNPVKLNVRSQQYPLDGEIEIKIGDESYFIQVFLEGNTEKEFIFSLPFNRNDREIEMIFRKDDHEEKERYELEMLHQEALLIGVLSETNSIPGYLGNTGNIRLGYGTAVAVNIADKTYLKGYDLRAFDFIVIDGYDTRKLTEGLMEGIRLWIKEGNTLFARDIAAVENIFDGAAGERSKKNAFSFGNGNIVILEKDIENIGEYFDYYFPYSRLRQGSNINNIVEKSQKNFTLGGLWQRDGYGKVYSYVGLIVIYLLLLMVVNHYKKGKGFLLMMLFSIAGFLIATNFLEFGTKSFAILEIKERGYLTDTATFIRFENNRENTQLKVQGDYMRNHTQDISKLYLNEGRILFQEEGEKFIYRRRLEDIGSSGIKLEIDAEDVVRGTIENPLSGTLEQAVLLIGDTLIPIGDMKGKESIQLHYSLDHNLSNTSDFNYLSILFAKGEFNSLQRMIFEYYYYHQDESLYNLKLIGFSSEQEVLEQNNSKMKNDKYVMHVLEIALDKEKETVYPMGSIRPQTVYEGYVDETFKREFTLEEEEALLIYYNIPRGGRVKAIDLNMKVEMGNPVIEVLNQETQRWEDIGYLSRNAIDSYISKEPLSIRILGESRIFLPQIRVLVEGESTDE